MKNILYISIISAITLSACTDDKPPVTPNSGTTDGPPPVIPFTVVNKLPHDTSYFTEGLEFYNGQLLESSGGNEDSSPYPSEMGVVDKATGKVSTKVKLDRAKYFGEGITVFKDKIYMLTWTSEVGFVYDAKTFKQLREFRIPSKQGWGLTHDTASLIMSDGSSNLYFLDPDSLRVKYTVSVFHNGNPVNNINELEYVNGVLYANKWGENTILKIDPVGGKVLGQINLDNLAQEAQAAYAGSMEMNGIAYDHATGKLYVTGKKWPILFEIKL
ncbi:glutaminyl-peptide cyclotransferase [Paraflavitalea sp. CAU 1676]|uniref:glutaminyl-peptide cyclotransferase n=1 Tax=Paraflavitalea sp. CAU 1676 TaxID=3032598 RepID=UPI0023D9D575|nr:glutaminyl-peptide cyclotransferase [Paraflavitalea sp. CAU 1676]MDF2191799.1 glutaminyl-peptide cyclotransferase [Paraflavitalea sp. CAU 1676]